ARQGHSGRPRHGSDLPAVPRCHGSQGRLRQGETRSPTPRRGGQCRPLTKEEEPMKAVVMAGGEGSRLRPLTCHRPQPLVPVVNRPVMQHILELLKRHGITEIVATLHYLAEEIEAYFGDGSDFGVNLQYTIEDTPLGTAGCVKKAQQLLQDDTFLIISGDALTDINLTEFIRFHRERKAEASICLVRVENPLEYGV